VSEPVEFRGRWLVIGHYGAGNTGDEAMCRALISASPPELRARMIVVSKGASGAPDGIERVPLEPGVLLRAFPRIAGVILGGGTHFHDEYVGRAYVAHLGSMVRHLVVYILTRLGGGRVIWVGVGVGPLRRRLPRILFRAAARTCGLIAVRDAASLERTQALTSHGKVELAFDLAALLTPPRSNAGGRARDPGGTVLGVSVMNLDAFRGFGPGGADRTFHHIAQALRERLAQDDGLRVRVFVIGQSRREDDRDISGRLCRSLERAAPGRVRLVEYAPDPRETLAGFAACDAVFATRYHSLLFGYLAGCRLAALAYNEKVADLSEELGLGARAVLRPSEATDPGAVASCIRGLAGAHADFVPGLPIDEARARALRNIEAMVDAIDAFDATPGETRRPVS